MFKKFFPLMLFVVFDDQFDRIQISQSDLILQIISLMAFLTTNITESLDFTCNLG